MVAVDGLTEWRQPGFGTLESVGLAGTMLGNG